MKRVAWFFLPVVLPLIFLPRTDPLYGQGQTLDASLKGTVKDVAGAVVTGAKVTLTSSRIGLVRTFSTSSEGTYVFALVPPGSYAIRVEKPGFGDFSQSGLDLALGQAANLDVTLQLSSVKQEILVTARVPILNSEDANIASEVTGRQILEVPLNIRNPFGLVALDSSVNNGPQFQFLTAGAKAAGNVDQDSAFFNFGGARFGTTAFLLDGHWLGAGDWGGIIYAPSVDETQEMKIQTNTYSAQYGWSMGNVISVATKSGTSEFHGSLFEFHRNSATDANWFFIDRAGVRKPSYRRNQFGAGAGGPLSLPHLYRQRNKTFIYGIYEGHRYAVPATLVASVPLPAFKNGDFSSLLGAQIGTDALGRPVLKGQIYNPFNTRPITAGAVDPATGLVAKSSGYIRDPIPGNIIPRSMFDPVAAKILGYWPAPNTPGTTNNLTTAVAAPVNSDGYTARVDHNISINSRLFARWSQKRMAQQITPEFWGPADIAGPGVNAPNNRWDTAFNFSQIFTPKFIMNATFGWGRWVEQRFTHNVPFQPSSLGLPTFLDGNPGGFPTIGVDGVTALGSAGSQAYPRETRSHSVDFTHVSGTHTVNFGFMWLNFLMRLKAIDVPGFSFSAAMTQGPDPTVANANTGYAFAAFLLGAGNGSMPNTARPSVHKNMYGWYIQDDWKVTSNFTINLGLRYDFQAAPTERFNRIAWFDTQATNPISSAIGMNVAGESVFTSPDNRGIYNPSHKDLAPRLGFAWRASKKLVVRGGVGIFYIPAAEIDVFRGFGLPGSSVTTPYVGSVDGITLVNTLSHPFPNGLLAAAGRAGDGLTNVGLNTTGLLRIHPTPYMEQWSLGFQYALTSNDRIEAGYVGNHGVKLPFGNVQLNQLPDQYLSLGPALLTKVPNPFYGHITTSGCGLDQPTVPRGQLLRPFPEFCNVMSQQQVGAFPSYNALHVSYDHRWNAGLEFRASFTASKFLSNSAGNETFAMPGAEAYRDYYNLAAEKSLDGADIPRSLVLTYIYQLPLGAGRHFVAHSGRVLNAVLGGWQVAGVSTFKDGFPLGFRTATNNTSSLGGGQRPDILQNPGLPNPTPDRWFDTTAFVQPPPYTFGNAARYDPKARAPGINGTDVSISKSWAYADRVRMQFRGEMFNAFNHPDFFAPNTSLGNPLFGRISDTYPPRNVQFGLKIYW